MREIETAVSAAKKAGDLSMKYFGRGVKVEIKPDGTPVTVADKLCDEKITSLIRKNFPSHAILSEESGFSEGNEFKWIVDPLDGTKDFIRGLPFFGSLVGLEKNGEVACGAACMPALGKTCFSENGKSFLNGKRTHVSKTSRMDDAVVFYSSLKNFGDDRLNDIVKLARSAYMSFGMSPLYGFLMVAEGVADAVVTPKGHPWDFAAIKAIIEGAGGKLTDFGGKETIYSGNAVVTNGILHERVIEMINK